MKTALLAAGKTWGLVVDAIVGVNNVKRADRAGTLEPPKFSIREQGE